MGSTAHEAVMVQCGYEENLCKLYRYSHNLATFYPYSCVKSTAACGQMWIVMFSFSRIGNQVWYVLTGANLHVTCLLWVWLSLLCVTTTQSLDVQVSMPRRNTMLLCVESCHSSQAWNFIPLSKRSLKSGNTCPSGLVVCLFRAVSGWVLWCEIHGDGFMGHIWTFWQHLLIYGTSTDVR